VAGGTATIASFPVRAGNALVSYAAYLGKVFWPYDLAPLYPYPAEVPFMKVLAACLLLIAITLLSVRFVRSAPWLLFGWLWYLGTLVPVIGLIKVGMQSMADRFTYIPSVGIFMMVVWGAGELVPSSRHWRVYAGVAAGAVLAFLSYRSWQQAAYWRDTITLFEHSLSVTGSNYQAGAVLVAAKRDKRVNELLQAGYLDAVAGRGQEAADRFNEAISLDPDNPQVYSGIADIFRRIGNCPKAVDLYGQALELDPEFAPARSGIEQCRGVLNQGR
jgi:tetratricopeptide (TPR) repeat protein